MITATQYQGKKIAVLGLGRTGLSAAKALQAGGAQVLAWDDVDAKREEAAQAGIPVAASDHLLWTGMDGLLVSPGVPLYFPKPHHVIAGAKRANCRIFSDLDILYEHQDKAQYIGITGTNGKSTVTSLIAHILENAGRKAIATGNIGKPVLSMEPLAEGETYVVEASSYQLDLARNITFDVAALLNITADHLDRHGTMENYVAAKKRIFNRQGKGDTAVVGIDNALTRKLLEEVKRQHPGTIIPVSVVEKLKSGVYCENGMLVDAMDGNPIERLKLCNIPRLPGVHNWQNTAFAYAITANRGVAPEQIVEGILSYPGLPHRQELAAVHRGIRYINDSKATNADAASRALVCYNHIYWIVGGKAKTDGLDMAMPYFNKVQHAYCIGEATEEFGRIFNGADVNHTASGTVDIAVKQAHAAAQRDGHADAVVLFSPACASFDQFKDFEQRGEYFKAQVAKVLKQSNAEAGV